MEIISNTGIDRNSQKPVFRQIYTILLAEIANGDYLETGKLPSEKELCIRFDVERNTVRKALQILVDQKQVTRVPGIGTRLISASAKNDYQENSDYASGEPYGKIRAEEPGKNGNIILLITQIDYLHLPEQESFHYKLIHSFEKRLSDLGYNMLFKPAGQDKILSETIRSAAPRGIIFDSYNQDSHYRQAAAFRLPCVSVNHYTPLFTSIVSNNSEGAYQIIKRFVDAGHRRIACIMGKKSHQTNMERLNGVHALYNSRGIHLPDEYFIPGEWTFSSGAEAAKKILDMKPEQRPTAIFAFNDDLAYGCYNFLKSSGISIPDEISLAGFDNSDRYRDMFPPITTVDVNLKAIVDYACWYLSSGLSGWTPKDSAKIQIDTTICENGTILPIKKEL